MILAAGLGTRLRPLTDRLPKPLLPIAGRPMIEFTLGWVAAAGIRDVMINLHHKGELIREALGTGERLGMTISYSEEPVILGTGGGLKRVEGFFKDEPFLIVNADVLTAFDPNDLIRAHAAHRPLATLAVRRDPAAATYGALGVDAEGRIRRFLGRGVAGESLEDVMFTGIHVLDPHVLAAIPADQFSPITDEYIAIVERGEPLRGHLTEAVWIDIGTPERYQEAQQQVARGAIPPWPSRLRSR
ncbi:MAG: nucleotidyltransferase family protein [Nitrospirota bacterium]